MKLHIYFSLILVSLAFFMGAAHVSAQDIPAGLMQALPHAAAKLNSNDADVRASILKEMIINEPGNFTQRVRLAFDLSKEDYVFAVGKVLEKDLRLLDKEKGGEGWWYLTYLVEKFEMKQFAAPLAVYLAEGYMDDPKGGLTHKLLQTMMALKAKEHDGVIAPYLKSPFYGYFALKVLTEIGSKKAIPPLIEKLTDENPGNRSWAVNKLAGLGVVEAGPQIAERLHDEDEYVRYSAIDALGRLNARGQSKELWRFFRSGADKRLGGFAIATLIRFERKEAVKIAIDDLKALVKGPRSDSIWAFIEKVKPKFLIPTLISLNKTKPRFFADATEEKVFRLYLFQKLVMYKTPLAIPLFRKRLVDKPNGENGAWKPNNSVASLLFDLNATEALDDLIDLFKKSIKPEAGAEANYGADELSTVLAKFGHRKTWKMLIDYAAGTKPWSRGRIISELNRQTDKKLWDEAHAKVPRAMAAAPIDVVAERISSETGIPITIEYVPKQEQALCASRNNNGCVEVDGRLSVYDVAASIVSGLNKEKYGEYTFLLDNGNIRILKTDTAIAWWRETMLRKANQQ